MPHRLPSVFKNKLCPVPAAICLDIACDDFLWDGRPDWTSNIRDSVSQLSFSIITDAPQTSVCPQEQPV